MAYKLLRCERDQSYMMPPSMRDWLSEGHLAWFIVDAVGQMDVREFYAAYRSDGWGAAAYDPGMMVAILLYAYCLGLRSSRRIARALEEDVGFRVVANRQPDFRTICRFRAEQEEALEELFVEVLRLCHEAGLVKLGVVALDGTKVAADAELATNRSHQAIEEEVQRMLAEAKAADAEEDAHYGPARLGDELPEGLGGRRERLKRLKEAKERLQREAEAAAKAVQEHGEQRRAEEVATGKKKRGRPSVEEAGGKAAEEAHHLVRRLLVSSGELGPTASGDCQGRMAPGSAIPWRGLHRHQYVGWPQAEAACLFRVSRATAAKWVHLSRDGGPDAFHDRSSRPRRSPRQTNQLREAAISGARQQGSYRGIKRASGERASSWPCTSA